MELEEQIRPHAPKLPQMHKSDPQQNYKRWELWATTQREARKGVVTLIEGGHQESVVCTLYECSFL